jgi:hypothetical protein
MSQKAINENKPQDDTHPAVRFAREVGAKSVVLPSPPLHERNAYAKADVSKIWALYGPEKEF